MTTRDDLLALTPDALAALTNRGLVKRAARDVEAAPPRIEVGPDGTVRGEFADGLVAQVPLGGLDRGTCTCGASGACRHVLAVVLAYQSGGGPSDTAPEEAAAEFVAWSPGAFTDATLEERIGVRLLNAARRVFRAGYVARVHRPTAADPVPRVELATATVRFLVPHDLGFVHTDAAAGARDDVLALAVWAFRAADEATAPAEDAGAGHDAQVEVGGIGGGEGRGLDGGADAALEAAVGLADDVLLGGAVHVGSGVSAAVARVRQGLERAGLRWPLLAVVELAEQLEAYRERSTRYRAEDVAGLVAELHARRRAVRAGEGSPKQGGAGGPGERRGPGEWSGPGGSAVQSGQGGSGEPSGLDGPGERSGSGGSAVQGGHGGQGGGSPRVRVLGTEEAAETPMRRARLDALGCRVWSAAGGPGPEQVERRGVDVYFAHADSATVLVLRREWETGEDGPALGRRRVGGASVAQLAAGNVVTESAVRSASRRVRLTQSRVAKTTVTASAGRWEALPGALVVRDLRALAAELDRLPPRVVRARVEAELVRVVAVAEVREVRYSPGAQRLDAVFADAQGVTATISATHHPAAPGALDAIAGTLRDGAVRFVSGSVRRAGGGIVVEPLAFAVGSTSAVVVPDLAEAGDGPAVVGGVAVGDAVDGALELLAEVPHRGLTHLPAAFRDRLASAADDLAREGLLRAAAGVRAFRDGLGPDPGATEITAWVDAYLRLLVTAELR
ncbi:SWIM zinc finger family protein [Dactylosporangium sp. AC04546]|uniref:SWIM zinc finger family protein n=1 Tax=Dactylosporangium sp. AC04546 TaxID=2862460 RepID=UPI002E7C27DE|nr:SWIM zinc finger family protein [Dactylosporangium sp. AC04546]WVK86089.1 SWIM zinc finger family protein [Dactylosporangium sp. AC04546]